MQFVGEVVVNAVAGSFGAVHVYVRPRDLGT